MNAVWPKGLLNEINTLVAFQYKFTPEKGSALTLAASNLYRLHVNGDFVGYGPARGAHGYSRVDTYDLSAYAGKEAVLTVEAFSSNISSYYTVKEAPFFAAEIKNGETLVAEAKDFTAYHLTERVQKVLHFSLQRTFAEHYRMTQNPLDFYMGNTEGRTPLETETVSQNKLIDRIVNYPTYEKLMGTAIEEGSVTVNPNAEVDHIGLQLYNERPYKRDFPLEELDEDASGEYCKFEFDKKPVSFGNAYTYRLYDLSRTLTGFFSFNVVAKKDTTLYIAFEEVYFEEKGLKQLCPFRGTCSNIVKYTLKAGNYRLMNFEANSAHFAQVIVTEGEAEIENFGMILYENPDAKQFTYDYGDADLNKIVQAAIDTFAQNAVDVLTDCPSRERAGWLCDSYFSSRSEALFTGKNLVEKSFLQNYAMYEKQPWLEENMIPMCYPADHVTGRYIPNWSMWYILELLNYVNRTGDEHMREISKKNVLGLVEFFKKYENEDGLLENLESWVFIEWSKCNDTEYTAGVNYPSNMLWASALEAADALYGMPELSEKAAKMRKVIREQSWNGTFFEENTIRDENGKLQKTGHLTETCQYYAFYFDLATPETDKELFERMVTEFGPKRDAEKVWANVYPSNAIVGNYLRLEILLMNGYTDRALEECKDFFLGMANTTGTLWEHSRLNASLNHGFASMAAVYIDQCFKGKKDLRRI